MNDEERNGLLKQRRLAREKCKKLQSNWNSLREWLKTRPEGIYHYNVFEEVLDKMNELERSDNK